MEQSVVDFISFFFKFLRNFQISLIISRFYFSNYLDMMMDKNQRWKFFGEENFPSIKEQFYDSMEKRFSQVSTNR